MARFFKALTAIGWPLLLGGCAGGPALVNGEAPGSSVAAWQMPWQLDPVSPTSLAQGEQTYRSYVAGTGYVRGTREALASIGHSLPRAAGLNRTVETCRRTVASQATKLGAKQIEAASAGPDFRNAKGQYVGPVRIRVNYRRHGEYEVREARLTCIVDRHGGIVDAYAGGPQAAGS